MNLSIIIVNYRSWDALEVCLKTLERATEKFSPSTEIIVVDNHSNDGRLAAFGEQFPSVDFLESESNLGFSLANDLGAESSKGEQLLFLNPDTQVSLQALVQWYEQSNRFEEATISGCAQVSATGQHRKVSDVFPHPCDILPGYKALRRHRAKSKVAKGEVDWITGAAVWMPRSIWRCLNGWGSQYFLYYEDVDLCRRATENGIRVVLLQDVVIRHDHGGATRRDVAVEGMTKSEVIRSRHIYFSRWNKGITRSFGHLSLALQRLTGTSIGALFNLLTLGKVHKLNHKPILLRHLFDLYLQRMMKGNWRSPRLPKIL